MGSTTLFVKILFADYEERFAILEFIGEWNDTLFNDVMTLKRNVIEPLLSEGIERFILIGENVLNFHASDDCYYEEWFDEQTAMGGSPCSTSASTSWTSWCPPTSISISCSAGSSKKWVAHVQSTPALRAHRRLRLAPHRPCLLTLSALRRTSRTACPARFPRTAHRRSPLPPACRR